MVQAVCGRIHPGVEAHSSRIKCCGIHTHKGQSLVQTLGNTCIPRLNSTHLELHLGGPLLHPSEPVPWCWPVPMRSLLLQRHWQPPGLLLQTGHHCRPAQDSAQCCGGCPASADCLPAAHSAAAATVASCHRSGQPVLPREKELAYHMAGSAATAAAAAADTGRGGGGCGSQRSAGPLTGAAAVAALQ